MDATAVKHSTAPSGVMLQLSPSWRVTLVVLRHCDTMLANVFEKGVVDLIGVDGGETISTTMEVTEGAAVGDIIGIVLV